MLMEFWFKTTSLGKPYYIGKKVIIIFGYQFLFFYDSVELILFDRMCWPYVKGGEQVVKVGGRGGAQTFDCVL